MLVTYPDHPPIAAQSPQPDSPGTCHSPPTPLPQVTPFGQDESHIGVNYPLSLLVVLARADAINALGSSEPQVSLLSHGTCAELLLGRIQVPEPWRHHVWRPPDCVQPTTPTSVPPPHGRPLTRVSGLSFLACPDHVCRLLHCASHLELGAIAQQPGPGQAPQVRQSDGINPSARLNA